MTQNQSWYIGKNTIPKDNLPICFLLPMQTCVTPWRLLQIFLLIKSGIMLTLTQHLLESELN